MKGRFFMKRVFFACLLAIILGIAPPNAGEAENRPTNERVEKLVKGMSLEEKAGQVMMGFFRGEKVSPALESALGEVRPGGVILYDSTGNIVSPQQVAALVSSIQETARSADCLPLFVAVDQEGGTVNRLKRNVTVFPGNMALGAAGDPVLARASARITAHELRILGITANFAPVTDVQSNPANPVIGTRSFGSDPALVALLGTAMVAPMAQEGVLCVAKHFPGHGNTSVDSHAGLPTDSHPRSVLEKINFAPFAAMIKAGVPAVMTAHIVMPDLDNGNPLPATLLPRTYSILREQMGFSGLAITDSLGMKALSRYWTIDETAVLALQAGADLLVFGADPGHEPEEQVLVHRALVSAVKTERIPMARLDEAVKRVLLAKDSLGILDDPSPRPDSLHELASPESLALSEAIARRSLTLAWNRFNPFPATGKSAPRALLWPLEKTDQAWALVEACPHLQPIFLPLSPASSDVQAILEILKGVEPVLVWAQNLDKFPAWKDLARSLGGRALLLDTGSPYGLGLCPDAGAALLTYSDSGASLKALGSFLAVPWAPAGKLPVEIPGLYPRGWGLSSVPGF